MNAVIDVKVVRGYIDKMKHSLALSTGQRQQLEADVVLLGAELAEVSLLTAELAELKAFFKTVSERARESAKVQLEEMGTLALRSTYGADYGFEIDFNPNGRSGTDALFFIRSMQNGKMIRNQPNGDDGGSRGGGAILLLALALRVGMMMAMDPPVDGPLILDEPFKEIDEPRRILAVNFLLSVARKFDMQIICISHDPLLKSMANKKFDFYSEDGYCYVKEVI